MRPHLKVAFALAALAQHQIARLGLTPEPSVEIAEHLAGLALAIDIEHHIVAERRQQRHPLVRALNFTLVAHFLGDIDDGNVDPAASVTRWNFVIASPFLSATMIPPALSPTFQNPLNEPSTCMNSYITELRSCSERFRHVQQQSTSS